MGKRERERCIDLNENDNNFLARSKVNTKSCMTNFTKTSISMNM